jgi:hypothetical protein
MHPRHYWQINAGYRKSFPVDDEATCQAIGQTWHRLAPSNRVRATAFMFTTAAASALLGDFQTVLLAPLDALGQRTI